MEIIIDIIMLIEIVIVLVISMVIVMLMAISCYSNTRLYYSSSQVIQ